MNTSTCLVELIAALKKQKTETEDHETARELAIAITHLETAQLWINKSKSSLG